MPMRGLPTGTVTFGPARAALGAQADAVHARGLELPFEDAVTLALGDQ
jgi:hypothetical protein